MLEHRLPVDRLYRGGQIANPELIADAMVFDVWTCNVDRNLGNIVASSQHGGARGRVQILAIDFEKAHVLRGELSRFEVTAIHTSRLWPLEELGAICAQCRFPDAMIRSVQQLTSDAISGVIEEVIAGLNYPEVPWRAATEALLIHRRDLLEQLVREVWQ
jgi:hypothetical protein